MKADYIPMQSEIQFPFTENECFSAVDSFEVVFFHVKNSHPTD